MSVQETERQKVLAEALVGLASLRTVTENFDDAKNSILRGVSDAATVSVNDVEVDRDTARAVVTKIRTASIDIQLNGTYFVSATNLEKADEIQLVLKRAQDGKEFRASFRDQSLDRGQIQLLQAAEWGRTPVFLSINATELRGDITSAKVISVTAQPSSIAAND